MDKIKPFFIFLILFQLHAQELGAEFLTAKSYTDQFRSFLLNKLKQMDQNFIRDINQGEISYISNENVTCLDGTDVEKNQPLMRIIFSPKLDGENYHEVRDYMGCNGKIAFQESIEVKGIDKPLHSIKDFYQNKLIISKIREYKEFTYSLIDNHGERVFSYHSSQISPNHEEMDFYLNNQIFFKRQILNKENVTYNSYGINFKMDRNGYTFSANSNARFSRPISARITPTNIEYYNPMQRRVSLAEFQKFFVLEGFNFIMDSLLAYYPKTTFVTSNLQSSKLLQELRDAQTFLINGVQLNLVRNLIEEYIEAVQKGEIVDNRK